MVFPKTAPTASKNSSSSSAPEPSKSHRAICLLSASRSAMPPLREREASSGCSSSASSFSSPVPPNPKVFGSERVSSARVCVVSEAANLAAAIVCAKEEPSEDVMLVDGGMARGMEAAAAPAIRREGADTEAADTGAALPTAPVSAAPLPAAPVSVVRAHGALEYRAGEGVLSTPPVLLPDSAWPPLPGPGAEANVEPAACAVTPPGCLSASASGLVSSSTSGLSVNSGARNCESISRFSSMATIRLSSSVERLASSSECACD
mmetsp:Transcript_31852/g.73233  ORF Transcript_31852/g.73233 Transcript_31852/m.73233 type:complete len:263 (+) Transcript_31852:1993-2781(+)